MTSGVPDIFLCHNRADKAWVRELGARLEAESIDGTAAGRRIVVFLDEWDIEKGENIVSRLGSEVGSGAFVAVVMSPEFFDSEWTRFEWTDVVARDPTNRAGRILPLRRRDLSLDGSRRAVFPAPFNALSYFDFRSDAHFEREFESLLRRIRNQPAPRGRSVQARYSDATSQGAAGLSSVEAAERVQELLVSNLAPLTAAPPSLYVASTRVKMTSDLPADVRVDSIPLLIWRETLVTFADLEDPESTLNSIIDPYSIERTTFAQCLRDADRVNLWLTLANKTVSRALRRKNVVQDTKGRYYFLPGPDHSDRTITIDDQSREVAARKRHHVTGDEFWVHYCADIRFQLVADAAFLRILPSYSFTHDGVESLDRRQSGRFRIIWGGRQDSATVLRQVLFWLRFMSDGHEEWVLETGGDPIRVSVMPATAAANVGIATDHVRIKALVEESSKDELAGVIDSAEVESAEHGGEDEMGDTGTPGTNDVADADADDGGEVS